MSGRKDYRINYAEERRLRLVAEQDRRRQQRLQRRQEVMKKNRIAAQDAAGTAVKKTRAALRSRSSQSKKIAEAALQAANEKFTKELAVYRNRKQEKREKSELLEKVQQEHTELKEENRARQDQSRMTTQNQLSAEQKHADGILQQALSEKQQLQAERVKEANKQTEEDLDSAILQTLGDRLQQVTTLVKSAKELGIEDPLILEGLESLRIQKPQADPQAMLDEVTGFMNRVSQLCDDRHAYLDELSNELETLVSLRSALEQDSDVTSFRRTHLQDWTRETDRLLNSIQSAPVESLEPVQRQIAQAEALQEEAGLVADRFAERNQLLSDIVSSLKEVGFFVQDPEYANADKPDGTVIVRANRGDQIMTAEVDLEDSVRSDWQGIEGQYCTSAFFDYVNAMGNKGVVVEPVNESLNPKLLQKGAKQLPSKGTDQIRERGQS